MIPIEEFIKQNDITNGFAWKNLIACCDEYNFYVPNDIDLPYDEIAEYVNEILEVPRRLVERNYWYDKVYSNDYYFTMKNDTENIYAAQTNIRMCKYFNGKWHWFNDDYKARLYSIPKSAVDDLEDLFIETHPVDDHGRLYCTYKDNFWTAKKGEELVEEYIPYDLDNESGDDFDYYDMIYTPPYSNLEFFDELPDDATEIPIPDSVDEDATPIQKVGYLLTHKTGSCFFNGR